MKQKGKFVNRFAYKDIKSETGYKDRILSRVMFRVKKNPATGLEDERMDREYLVVLKRR